MNRPARLDGFDGLRACAALSVLAYHATQACGLAQSGTLAPLFGTLKFGVTIFFVISGFLLYLPYARAIRAGRELPSWRRFAQRRLARIVPAYWVALTILAAGPLAGTVLSGSWWRYYGLVQIYSIHTIWGGLAVAWSLAVEISFYALLPGLAWTLAALARRRPRSSPARLQAGAIALLALASIVLRFELAGSPVAPVAGGRIGLATSLPGLFDWFAAGMLLAVLTSAWEAGSTRARRLAALSAHPVACWLLAAEFVAVVIVTHPLDLFLPQYGLVDHLAFGLAAALLVLGLLGPAQSVAPARPPRLLRSAPVAWLGTISYGIYLWHFPIVRALRGPLSAVPAHPDGLGTIALTLLVVGAASIALAAASWYLVERPAQRRVSRRSRPVREGPGGAREGLGGVAGVVAPGRSVG